MNTGGIATIFVSGIITIAALSLIFAPRSNVAAVVSAVGNSLSQVIGAAKAYPSGY